MDLDWVTSAAGRRVLVHWADPRPAWLWSSDGGRLLWRNSAARLFGAKLKKHGLRFLPGPVPIRGQIARLVRLGSLGRSSLARVQFLAGQKPVSTTCTVTPLALPDDHIAVLLVAVDPIDAEIRALPDVTASDDSTPASLLPPGTGHLVVAPGGRVVGGTPEATERFGPLVEADGIPEGDSVAIEMGDETVRIVRLTASPEGHQLLLIEGAGPTPASIADIRAEDGLAALEAGDGAPTAREGPSPEEPLLPMGLPPAPTPEAPAEIPEGEPWAETGEPPHQSLSSLFDRLADSEQLYGELSADDEHFVPPPESAGSSPADDAPASAEAEPPAPANEPKLPTAPDEVPGSEPVQPEPDTIAAIIAFDDDLQEDRPKLFRVTGRGFTPLEDADADKAAPGAPVDAPENEADQESRRNFSELGRLLADRVGPIRPGAGEPPAPEVPPEPPRVAAAVAEGALINIAAETFILNRLPLGILVFRDQQVLFANRALTDLVGYETIDSLRSAGLKAIFPGDDSVAGPVTHLVRRDGTSFPVTARLQSITWQGRPALMLSAAAAEPQLSHEAAVRTFAELLAAMRDEGFITADRSGRVTLFSAVGRSMLGIEAEGQQLAALIEASSIPALRTFLEQPARFAETARPGITLPGSIPGTTLTVFAEGQAGIVAGYFGIVQRASVLPSVAASQPDEDRNGDVDPSMLARVSRGVRRPLNTIIGFADLIRSAAFGTIENHRYLEYARDIKTAGQEIAVLVDELDDYSRLRAGNYATRPADLDLGGLLESCLLRVRGQANAARVLVRSAVSERLPHVQADRASLGQAMLNILASAIDQTPAGGTVILSAQLDEDGSIVVNVRDSGAPGADPGERFVVFRDGVGKDGEALAPVRSSVGLALTRSLVAVNACSLSVTPAGAVGTLFTLTIPAGLVVHAQFA